jgi:hypothetical protein
LKRKIALLQHISGSLAALIAEPFVPDNRKSLRDWNDEERGLWAWSDVKLDNPNHMKNRELIKAFFKARDDIEDLKKGKQSDLRRKVKDRDAIIERIELRNAELLEEVNKLRNLVHTCARCSDKLTKLRTSS